MQCHVAYRSRECRDKDLDEHEDGNSQPNPSSAWLYLLLNKKVSTLCVMLILAYMDIVIILLANVAIQLNRL